MNKIDTKIDRMNETSSQILSNSFACCIIIIEIIIIVHVIVIIIQILIIIVIFVISLIIKFIFTFQFIIMTLNEIRSIVIEECEDRTHTELL